MPRPHPTSKPSDPQTPPRRSVRWAWGLGVVFALGLIAGCGTPENRQRMLSRFFDGVTVPGKTNAITATAASPVAPTNAAPNRFIRPVSTASPGTLVVSIHEPYAKRECQECHSARFSNALRAPREQLCLGCHAAVVADAPIVHTPVRNGECLACHNPHTTETPHLLVKRGPDLCLQCHDASLLSEVEGHRLGPAADCAKCHDPHRGTRNNLLRNVAALTPPPKS